MFDLAVHTLSVPVLVAVGGSLLFDLGGVYLILLSIKYATTDDSGFWTELGAYLFIGASAWVVYQHGVLEGYPLAGVLFFAAAPVVLGIILKATLQYLTRQQRRSAGRVTERLPSVGWFTWVRYGPQAWRLMSVAMQGRLVNAADRLEIKQDRHGIFGQPETIVETPAIKAEVHVETQDKKPEQLPEPVSKPALTSGDKLSLPVWLPNEPDMKLATLVRTCFDNGVFDIETIYRYAMDIKGPEVNKMTLVKTISRQKAKTI
jgi:hypothetical protein